jgi:general secretion pathway protein G
VRDRDRLPAKWNELTERDSTGRPYLDFANPPPLDPWRRPYIYEPDFARRTWRVKTLGRDGEPGGSGDEADVICEGSIDGVKSLTNPRADRPTDR